jgi:hypothetical protein
MGVAFCRKRWDFEIRLAGETRLIIEIFIRKYLTCASNSQLSIEKIKRPSDSYPVTVTGHQNQKLDAPPTKIVKGFPPSCSGRSSCNQPPFVSCAAAVIAQCKK